MADDTGSSLTYVREAGTIRKDGYIVIKKRPCKVVDVSSKTGHDGHAKSHFVGVDIFTGKEYEELISSSQNVDVPDVKRVEYSLLDIDDNGKVSLLDPSGSSREDLSLPKGSSAADNLAKQLRERLTGSDESSVIVLEALGESGIEVA